jgi:hypothetical protein
MTAESFRRSNWTIRAPTSQLHSISSFEPRADVFVREHLAAVDLSEPSLPVDTERHEPVATIDVRVFAGYTTSMRNGTTLYHAVSRRRIDLDSAGSECVACHMPKIAQEIGDVNVRSHTFAFVPPSMTDAYKIPNPCTSCHTDESTDWARQALKGWRGVSP